MAEQLAPEDNEASRSSTDPAENITRRDFIKRTALTLGGIAVASALPSVANASTPPVIHARPTTSLGASLPPMDFAHNPYTARGPVTSQRGIVATSTPLAVEAGLLILRNGGNAVDAAIATAIAQTVVEPVSNGVGSDAFALIWDSKAHKLYGLNGSGRAPAALTLQVVRNRGYTSTLPLRGWLPVTVPGAPALWRDLHARFGKLPFNKLFEPAIAYAEQGFRVSPVVASAWQNATNIYPANRGAEYAGWKPMFMPGGRAPKSGQTWSSIDLGATLRRIADFGADDFYKGELARKMAKFSAQTGGYLTEADLAAHTSTWVDPISTTYRGYGVWELPPNTQGIAALIALNILENYDLGALKRDSVQSFHPQIEAIKLAFADAFKYVADPAFATIPTAGLLDKAYATRRSTLIGERALTPAPGNPNSGGTVYLCAADADGMMVSFIQSNYQGFGSGIVIPGTGISLHDRGANFSLDPNHANRLAPGKRPYHTIIPGFLTRNGQPIGPFGVMGGFMQPQGHVQVLTNTIDYAMNPQAALDAPRWQWTSGKNIEIESDADPAIIRALRAKGHTVTTLNPSGTFGRGQIIWRNADGSYVAGSDKRGDGYAGAL